MLNTLILVREKKYLPSPGNPGGEGYWRNLHSQKKMRVPPLLPPPGKGLTMSSLVGTGKCYTFLYCKN